MREALPFVYHSYSIKLAIVKFHVPGFHYSSLDVRMIHPSIMGNSFLILVSFQFSCFFRLVNKQNRSHILCFDSENKNFRIANELTFGYSKDCVQLFRILKHFKLFVLLRSNQDPVLLQGHATSVRVDVNERARIEY